MATEEVPWRVDTAFFLFGLAAFGILVLLWNFLILVYRSYLSGALYNNKPDPFRWIWIGQIKPAERIILGTFCPYYARLNEDDKDEFLYRMALFIFNNTAVQNVLSWA